MIEELIRQVANLQKQVDSLVKVEVPGWVSWTASLNQGVAVTISAQLCKYYIVGKLAIVKIAIVPSSAGTSGQPIVVSGLPTEAQTSDIGRVAGGGMIVDTGTSNHVGVIYIAGANDIRLSEHQGNYAGQAPFAFGLANGDYISYIATYEIN